MTMNPELQPFGTNCAFGTCGTLAILALKMTQKWFKAADVCEMAELQPYVLRSWEKEFPGIGVQKSADSPRLYRQSDLEQVKKIKQLVFGEGLTLAGARRRIEESEHQLGAADKDVEEVLEALASDARTRIASVRDGLRSILKLLSSAPGTVVVVDDYRLEPPPSPSLVKGARRSIAARSKATVASKRVAAARKPARPAKRNKRASA
jgi:DNA-binding transcriptional MerR regulator